MPPKQRGKSEHTRNNKKPSLAVVRDDVVGAPGTFGENRRCEHAVVA